MLSGFQIASKKRDIFGIRVVRGVQFRSTSVVNHTISACETIGKPFFFSIVNKDETEAQVMLEAKSQLDPQTSRVASTRRAGSELPLPQQYPQSDVVIYDGNCVFCTKQVQNLKWLDGRNRMSFVSLHDPFVARHFPDLQHEQLMEQIYLIPFDVDGYSSKRYGGAAAIRYLSRRLPKLWIFAPLLHVPFTLPIQQWFYRQIAKRRYKIAGKQGADCDENGTCEVHFKD